MTEIAVIGAGFVGVSTAIALRQQGQDVVLVDKQGLGAGASFGNAGVLQSEAVVPYAMPRSLPVLARVLLGRDTSVALKFPGVFGLAGPLVSYFLHSSPKGVARASVSYAKLIKPALLAHKDLAHLAGAEAMLRGGGYRMRFIRQSALQTTFDDFSKIAQEHDLPLRLLSPEAFSQVEPGLADTGVGGLEWSGPYHVAQPAQLLGRYLAYFQSLGGDLIQGDALGLTPDGAGWTLPGADGPISAGQVVIATGADTARIARRLGGTAPIVPKRGYHAVLTGGAELNAPLVDAELGFVYSPNGNGIRVATGAELGATTPSTHPRQLSAGIAQAARLFGTDTTPTSTWSGVRPCMPDMLPVMGRSGRHKGIWYNFGHGHQGLTLGPWVGQLLAGAMTEQGALDPALGPDRFSL